MVSRESDFGFIKNDLDLLVTNAGGLVLYFKRYKCSSKVP